MISVSSFLDGIESLRAIADSNEALEIILQQLHSEHGECTEGRTQRIFLST